MRNQIRILFYVLLSTTIFSGITGCKTGSSGQKGWLTPDVRGQAPLWEGPSNPDPYSNPQDTVPVSFAQPMQPTTPQTPYSPVSPTLQSPQDFGTPQPQYQPQPEISSYQQPVLRQDYMNPQSFPPQPPYQPQTPNHPQPQIPANPLPVAPPQPLQSQTQSTDDPFLAALQTTPESPRVAAVPQPITSYSERGTPLPHPGTVSSNVQPAFASPVANATSQGSDPWGFDTDHETQNAVSLEAQAQKELDAQERAKLAELAEKQNTGKQDYLKPLPKWNGPFEMREKKQTIEQEIIQQVGYTEEKPQGFDNLPVYDWEKEEEKGFDWSVLDPVTFFTKVRDWVGMGPDEKKANAAMKKGREILLSNQDLKDQKKSLEAAKLFAEAAKRWPDSLLEEDALHLAGECYFFADDYPRAMTSYQKLVIKYQHSKHIDNAVKRLFKIAQYWEKEDRRGASSVNMTDKSRPTFDTFGHAKKAYETIFINDPNGPIADDAMMALATAYYLKGRYQGDDNYNHAAYYYQRLREDYPLSEHITKAHSYELESRTKAYMGAEHSSTTLDEAEKLADVTLKQFSSELDEQEKEEILEIKEGVIRRQAEREWTMGQFYDKKAYYGSARLYYEKLLDKYPQTEYAEKARIRLEQIKNKPDQPDQLDFIKKVFRPRGE